MCNKATNDYVGKVRSKGSRSRALMKAIKNECMTTFKAGRQFYIWTILNWCDFLDLNEGAKMTRQKDF